MGLYKFSSCENLLSKLLAPLAFERVLSSLVGRGRIFVCLLSFCLIDEIGRGDDAVATLFLPASWFTVEVTFEVEFWRSSDGPWFTEW